MSSGRLQEGTTIWKIIEPLAARQKVVAVAYEMSFNYRALTGNLMFWIGGRLREVVAHGGSTELTNCLRGFAEHNRYKKICNLWTPLNTRNLHGGNTVHISLKAKIKCY